MAQIPTTRGNPQASEIAVQNALDFIATLSREDLQTVLEATQTDLSRLYEDRNILLAQGGVLTFTGTELQLTENLNLILSTEEPAGTTTIDLGAGPFTFTNDGDVLYATIDRSLGTATTNVSSSMPSTNNSKEVFLIAKRIDTPGTEQRLYFRSGTALDAGQSASLGASGSGTGAGNNDLEALTNSAQSSSYKLLSPITFVTDEDTLTDPSSTGEFSTVSKKFEFDIAGETFVSVNLLDAEEFLDEGVDLEEAGIILSYDLDNIDDSPTVELSRDGGSNYQSVTLERVGETDTYAANHIFTAEPTNSTLESNTGITTGSDELTDIAGANPEVSFSFSVANSSVINEIAFDASLNGSPEGTLYIQVAKDNGGSPGDLVSSTAFNIAALSAGTNTLTLGDSPIIGGDTYHIVYVTDTTYKAGYVANTTSLEIDFNATGSIRTLLGRELDLRLRITSSDPTGNNPDNLFRLRSIGVLYDRDFSIPDGLKNFQRFQFSSSDNLNQFTLNFIPDPELLNIYYTQTGQVFKIDGSNITISGSTVIFPPDTFDNGGVESDITLLFSQAEGTVIDNSDSNAAKIAELQSDPPLGTNWYEEDTFDATFTANSSSATTNTVAVEYVRVGRQVTIMIPELTFTSNGSDEIITSGVVLPTTIRPTRRIYSHSIVIKDSSGQNESGVIRINTDGTISIYKDNPETSGPNWTNGTSGTHHDSCLSYLAS